MILHVDFTSHRSIPQTGHLILPRTRGNHYLPAKPVVMTAGYKPEATGPVDQEHIHEIDDAADVIIRERLIDCETGIERIALEFPYSKTERKNIVVDRQDITTPAKLFKLANHGLYVHSGNAKELVACLNEQLFNKEQPVPMKYSTRRMGWIDRYGFLPYTNGVVFDGDHSEKLIYDSVNEAGRYDVWLEIARIARQGSVEPRIILAASFASVLVKVIEGLPFFVHLWGPSETGKTVALRLAASVFANPAMGSFIQSFNATDAGLERRCAFLNSLPLITDELQVARAAGQKSFDKMIYSLTEGVGRTRSNKGRGMDPVSSWANCMITSGEEPVTGHHSAGGAINRVLDIECNEALFENPGLVIEKISRNYGHAGRRFVENLTRPNQIERAKTLLTDYERRVQAEHVTDKQSLAAAILLVADHLATEWIFEDGQQLQVADLVPFLKTMDDISVYRRGYDNLVQWVYLNRFQFGKFARSYGLIDGHKVRIIKPEFINFCDRECINVDGFLRWLRKNGKLTLRKRGTGFTFPYRILSDLIECVVIELPTQPDEVDSVSADT